MKEKKTSPRPSPYGEGVALPQKKELCHLQSPSPFGEGFRVRFINFLFIFLILISSGCQKIMREQETQIANINSTQEMNVALDGLYSRLTLYMNDWFNTFGDDITAYYSEKNVGGLPQYLGDRKFYRAGQIDRWALLYKVVTNANNLICQLEKKKELSKTLKGGLGEAYLIRAYAYFRLVRIFGEIPIIKDIQ